MTDARAFRGFRFPAEVILWAVRWYLQFPISYRDFELMLADRGVEVDHTTMYRWVQRFAPERPWCTDQRDGHTDPDPRPGSRDADGLRVAELEHAVQGTNGDGHLDRLTTVRARAESIADHPLVAGHRRLGQRAAVIAGCLLPAQAAMLG